MGQENGEKIFADGIVFKEPNENAPDFIVGKLWVKVDEFKAWLDAHNTNNGGINIDIKRSAKGNIYCELDTWKPNKPTVVQDTAQDEDINPDNIPF